MKLTENAQKALTAIKETKLGKFSAKTLSSKCGYTVSPQTLSALAKKGILNKLEGTSPVEYTFIGEFEMKGDGVASVGSLANRYAQYKVLIKNRVLDKISDVEGYEYYFTLSGGYIEQTIYDVRGINYPKTKPYFLGKKVDDIKAFTQAWKDLTDYHMEVLD